ncbi:family 20 glycosylhydrolase [Pedobacter glucosidilyticus]|uniref:family 20 glycosylhydrolase n=1 Tax=Pedobacter glucosidilyticus TaxID=1122941 RepID=UPI0026EF6B3E|nr:family 20 glycosylhydrolase [Pedobacter glucosidilyticus]
MRFYFFIFCSLLSCSVFSQAVNQNLGIIPAPQEVVSKEGFFVLTPQTAILYQQDADRKIAELFRDLVKQHSGFELVVAKNFIQAPESLISFINQALPQNPEAYEINIGEKQITLSGQEQGLFYAMQSLAQLYQLHKNNLNIPQAIIKDQPRFQYRGLHLDVGRHFYPLDFIKKYIDIMAMYKLNNFHWHLTEDQGWRLEIKKYPKLTEIGAYRAQTLIGNFHDRMPQWFDNKPYGGFYTQEEAKEIVAYAASKYINVIPEIELPGHAVAALASYPEFACGDTPGPFKVEEKWGVFPDIFCAGKEETFSFLEDILTEVMAIFPSSYIHIGGDEAPKTRWKTCSYCQKRIKAKKLKNEEELQSYFIQRIEKFVNKNGRKIIGWDEILEGGLAPNATVMSWRGEKGGIAAAQQNHDVIMTPGSNGLYLDHVQGRSDQEPLSIGGDGRIGLLYQYNPTPSVLTAAQQKYIKGVQANMWTEYMPTTQKVEYMLFPRVMALAEVAWTNTSQKDYQNFAHQRLPLHLNLLDQTSTLYRVPTAIGAKDTTLNIQSSYTFTWKPSVKDAIIYYTLDGKIPDATCLVYQGNLEVTVKEGERIPVKSIVITPSGKRSAVITTWLVNRKPLEAITDTPAVSGSLKYHYVPGKFTSVLEIDTNLATKKGLVNQLALNKISGKDRSYGLVFSGYIKVNEDATFEFSLLSDDGARLYIDDELIIDNDGKHARYERAAGVWLRPGLHKIKLAYFDDGLGSALKLSVKGTDGKKIELPPVMMFN